MQVGGSLTLSAESSFGPVTFEVDPHDAPRAHLDGAVLTGVAPGPVKVTARTGDKAFEAHLAVVERTGFQQLSPSRYGSGAAPAPGGWSGETPALWIPEDTDLDAVPIDHGLTTQDVASHSVLLLISDGYAPAVATRLDVDGTKATMSFVIPTADSFGFVCSCDPRGQIDRYLVPEGISTVSVVVHSVKYWRPHEMSADVVRFADMAALPNVIVASVSPNPMVYGAPFTISGKVLGNPSELPQSLTLSINGYSGPGTTFQTVEIGRVPVSGRQFAITGTLSPTMSDGTASLTILAPTAENRRTTWYRFGLKQDWRIFWQEMIDWALPG